MARCEKAWRKPDIKLLPLQLVSWQLNSTDADYFLGPQRSLGNLNEFEYLLIETTFARLIQDTNNLGMQNSGSELFRERTLFALDQLDKLSYIKEPKFVFVHLIVPHPPYVFGSNRWSGSACRRRVQPDQRTMSFAIVIR